MGSFDAECQALRKWEAETLSKHKNISVGERLTFLPSAKTDSATTQRYRILSKSLSGAGLSLAEAAFNLMKQHHNNQLRMRAATTLDSFRAKLLALCGEDEQEAKDSAAMAVAFHKLFGLTIRIHPGNKVYSGDQLVFGDSNNGNGIINIGHVYGRLYVPLDETVSQESVESELSGSKLSRLVEQQITAEIQGKEETPVSSSGDSNHAAAAASLAAAEARAKELNDILDLFEDVQQIDESCEPPTNSVNEKLKNLLAQDPSRYQLCTVQTVRSSSGLKVGVPVGGQQEDGLSKIELKGHVNWLQAEQVLVELLEPVSTNGTSKGRVLGYYKRQMRYNFLSRQELQRHLTEQPDRFKICSLELSGVQAGSAVPIDPSDRVARIQLNGRENCGRACANDQVVVEIMGTDPATGELKGRVVGMHQQAEKLRYQLFLCEMLSDIGALMRPLCGTFPKIAYDNSIAQRAFKDQHDDRIDGHDERDSAGQQQVTHKRDRELRIDRDFVSVFSPKKDSTGRIYFESNGYKRVNKAFCDQTFLVCFEFWHLDKSYPIGKVVYVLESADGSLSEAFGLIQMRHRLPRPLRESAEVSHQAASVLTKGMKLKVKNRLDLRQVPTVTIDNPDTRDMDDAISYERCESTRVETVGVHITDVCDLIGKRLSPLDRLARSRLWTIYPPKVAKSQMQQVTPNHMLPRDLAENVLSLCEGADRNCLSVIFKFKRDDKNNTKLTWEKPSFHQTVIRNDLRLNKIDVQPVLLESDRSPDSFGDRLTSEFVTMLRSLWDIARRLRLNRLGEAGFQLQEDDFCDDNDEDGIIGKTFETGCLIEELMVLANLSVGQWLANLQRPVVARVQEKPRRAEVDRWLGSYSQILVHMPRLQRDLRGLGVSFSLGKFPLSLSKADYEFIMKYQNGKPRECVLRLMHDSRHPHMMLALSEWFSVTQPAHYAPTDETGPDGTQRRAYHFSLQQGNYVHFTSPMRRYADIVVHRAFRAAIADQQSGAATGETADSLRDLCDSLRTLERRAKMFEKDSVSYAYAMRLKHRPQQELVVVRSIDDAELVFTSSRLRRMPKTLGVVKMSSFGLDARPVSMGNGKFRCKWSRRIFVHPSFEDKQRIYKGGAHVQHHLGSEVRVKRDFYVQRVNCDPVVQLRQEFIKSGANYESMRGRFRRLQDVLYEDRGTWMITCENDQIVSDSKQQLLVSGKPVQFYREFAVGDIMRLQFRAQLRQGLLTPSVALIEVCESHAVCVTHKDDPVRCFAEVTDVKSKPSYRDIAEYASIWQRIVAIESATIAASTDDSVILHEVALEWTYHQPTDRWLGAFHLPSDFCIQRQIKFGADATLQDPLLQEKINELEMQSGRGGGPSLSEMALKEAFELAGDRDRYSDYLCLRFPGNSSKAAGSDGYFTAVAHGGILLVYETAHGLNPRCNVKRDEFFTYDCQIVVFSLRQHDLGPRFDWSTVHSATVEVLQKFLPVRRQELALWRLPSMPKDSLAHKIALLGSKEQRVADLSYRNKLMEKKIESYSIETGTEQRYNEHTGRSYFVTKKIPCNNAQRDAITEAMQFDLTLIWGPPGTGKTSTGVMLAYWFAFVNRCFDENLLDAASSEDEDDDDDDLDQAEAAVKVDGAEAEHSAFDRGDGDATAKANGTNESNGQLDDGEWEGLAEALRQSLMESEWSTVGHDGRPVERRSTRRDGPFDVHLQQPAATPLPPKRFAKQPTVRQEKLQTRRQVLYCGPSNRSVDVVAEYLKTKLGEKCPKILRVFSEQHEQKNYPVPGDAVNRSSTREAGGDEISPMMQEIALHKLIRLQKYNPVSADIIQSFDNLFKRFLAEVQHTQAAWLRALFATAQSDSKFMSYLQRLVIELFTLKPCSEPKVYTFLDLSLVQIITAYRKFVTAAKMRVLQQFEIVLCTTSVSCSSVLQAACKFSQIIIDEAGMCTEPETLVPLVDCSVSKASNAKQADKLKASHFAERLVLIGDHKQLRPIIQNRTAEQLGLGVSLFERHSHRAIMLNYQYRMHPSLCEFSADYFYRTSKAHLQTRQSPSWTGLQQGDDVPDSRWNGINTHRFARSYVFDSYNFKTQGRIMGKQRLENVNVLIGCWPAVRRQADYRSEGEGDRQVVYSSHHAVKPEDLHPKGEEDRIVFLHVEGAEEKVTVATDEGSENSCRNMKEIDEVIRVYKEILKRAECPRLFNDSLAVLSQYRYQVTSIEEQLRSAGIRSPIVKTVIESQGSEYDYVILSLVRSLPNYEIPKFPIPSWERKYLGFITDANQINVALTRARRGLIIIGNRFLLQANPMWSELLCSLQSRRCLIENPAKFPSHTGDKRYFTRDGSDPKLAGQGANGGGGGGGGAFNWAWRGGQGATNGGPYQPGRRNQQPMQPRGFEFATADFPRMPAPGKY